MKLRAACAVVGFLSLVLSMAAQTAGSASASAQVPPLIQFSNVATDEGGNTLSGVVKLTFSLYAAQQGGDPLWTETQNNVQLDPTGHYSVQLGITKPGGVPTTLFTTGEARWLGVQIAQQPEQPRALLLSVPYALKAGDAATVGGLPPSAFVLAAPPNESAAAYIAESASVQTTPPPSSAITGTGKVNYLPLWDSTSDILSSVLFQSGTGKTAKIGINTITPAATLDVKGGSTIRGTLSLPATAKATASAGTNSEPLNLVAAAFNSTSSTALNQTFQWLAEPASNNTSTPSGTLNLLFGEGATKPSETGLNIASDGVITFATGQTFPGTGNGTVTSVSNGAGLTGGPITTSGTLSIATGGVTNAMLANPSLTVAVGTGLTGGGSVTLGASSTPISLATNTCASGSAITALPFTCTPFAALGTNTFTGTQTVNSSTGNALTATASSPSTLGLVGYNTAATGTGAGVLGEAYSPGAAGVVGYNFSTTDNPYGVFGAVGSVTGVGVNGSGWTGVKGASTTSNGYGVFGINTATSGNAYGVAGFSSSTTGIGVYGIGSGSGVTGVSGTATGSGVVGINTSGGNAASFTGPVVVTGNQTVSGNLSATGVVTGSSFQIGSNLFDYGNAARYNAFTGFAGNTTTTGQVDTATGYLALASNTGGTNNTADGAQALQSNTSGDYNTASGSGALQRNTSGSSNVGVGNAAGFTLDGSFITGSYNTLLGFNVGLSTGSLNNATAIGANAEVAASNSLVLGSNVSVGIGTTAPAATLDVHDNGNGNNTISAISASTTSSAVYGSNTATSGIAANGGYFITASPQASGIYAVNTGSGGNDYAAYLQGNVYISGNLAKSTGTFQIDHPLDPANKYLYHSFVESPDMMNVYNGNVITNKRGIATVILPDYFEALNRDFRYQLTVIGQFAQAIVARKIGHNRFVIRTSKPNVEVSWQVTGIRHDAYANAHRIHVEEEKPPQEQGRYLHPELFGAPAEQAIGYQAPPVPTKYPTPAEKDRVSSLKAPPALPQ